MTCGMNLELDLEALRRTHRTRSAEEGVVVEDEVHLGVALLPVLDDINARLAKGQERDFFLPRRR